MMINDYCPTKQPDFFIDNKCTDLLVTIGDSWTWGDSLGQCTVDFDDIPARKAECFGYTMSKKLNSNWLNIGFCGAGNGYLIKCLDDLISGQHVQWLNQASYDDIRDLSWPSKLQEVRDGSHPNILEELRSVYCKSSNPYTELIKQYQNVYIVLTLTETGRDFSRYDWMHHGQTRVADYMVQEEMYNFSWLNQITFDCEYPIIVARNFTVDLDETAEISACLSKNWVQINWENNGADYPGHIDVFDLLVSGPASGVVFKQPSLSSISDYKQWFVQQISMVEPLWNYLRNNSLNHNRATCHPTRESHVLWANYLLDHF